MYAQNGGKKKEIMKMQLSTAKTQKVIHPKCVSNFCLSFYVKLDVCSSYNSYQFFL